MRDDDMPRESFLFIRHGKTDWSTTNITQGPANLPLNMQGEQDAKKAATILGRVASKDCIIISSDLTRAIQTAEIIAQKMTQPILVFPNLHERYFGDFRLLSTTETLSEDLLPPDAESQESFQKRISRAFSEVLKTDNLAGKQKIIVSHGQVFKHLSLLLTGQQESIDYGDVFLFTPNEIDKTWHLQKINPDSSL